MNLSRSQTATRDIDGRIHNTQSGFLVDELEGSDSGQGYGAISSSPGVRTLSVGGFSTGSYTVSRTNSAASIPEYKRGQALDLRAPENSIETQPLPPDMLNGIMTSPMLEDTLEFFDTSAAEEGGDDVVIVAPHIEDDEIEVPLSEEMKRSEDEQVRSEGEESYYPSKAEAQAQRSGAKSSRGPKQKPAQKPAASQQPLGPRHSQKKLPFVHRRAKVSSTQNLATSDDPDETIPDSFAGKRSGAPRPSQVERTSPVDETDAPMEVEVSVPPVKKTSSVKRVPKKPFVENLDDTLDGTRKTFTQKEQSSKALYGKAAVTQAKKTPPTSTNKRQEVNKANQLQEGMEPQEGDVWAVDTSPEHKTKRGPKQPTARSRNRTQKSGGKPVKKVVPKSSQARKSKGVAQSQPSNNKVASTQLRPGNLTSNEREVEDIEDSEISEDTSTKLTKKPGSQKFLANESKVSAKQQTMSSSRPEAHADHQQLSRLDSDESNEWRLEKPKVLIAKNSTGSNLGKKRDQVGDNAGQNKPGRNLKTLPVVDDSGPEIVHFSPHKVTNQFIPSHSTEEETPYDAGLVDLPVNEPLDLPLASGSKRNPPGNDWAELPVSKKPKIQTNLITPGPLFMEQAPPTPQALRHKNIVVDDAGSPFEAPTVSHGVNNDNGRVGMPEIDAFYEPIQTARDIHNVLPPPQQNGKGHVKYPANLSVAGPSSWSLGQQNLSQQLPPQESAFNRTTRTVLQPLGISQAPSQRMTVDKQGKMDVPYSDVFYRDNKDQSPQKESFINTLMMEKQAQDRQVQDEAKPAAKIHPRSSIFADKLSKQKSSDTVRLQHQIQAQQIQEHSRRDMPEVDDEPPSNQEAGDRWRNLISAKSDDIADVLHDITNRILVGLKSKEALIDSVVDEYKHNAGMLAANLIRQQAQEREDVSANFKQSCYQLSVIYENAEKATTAIGNKVRVESTALKKWQQQRAQKNEKLAEMIRSTQADLRQGRE